MRVYVQKGNRYGWFDQEFKVLLGDPPILKVRYHISLTSLSPPFSLFISLLLYTAYLYCYIAKVDVRNFIFITVRRLKRTDLIHIVFIKLQR